MSRSVEEMGALRTLQNTADGQTLVRMLEREREDNIQRMLYASPTQVQVVQGRVQVLDELLSDFVKSTDLAKRGA